MKKLLLAGASLLVMVSASSAADLAARPYTKAPAYVAPIYNWTGFYIGGFVGGAFGGSNSYTSDFAAGTLAASNRQSAFFGGGTLGANYQFGNNWVLGVEGDIGGLSSNDRTFTDLAGGGVIRDRNDWLASVTGRLGYTWGQGLLYVKGGAAFRDDNGVRALNLAPGDIVGISQKDTGYTIGGGLEYMFAPAWSAKIEYQYYNFGHTHVDVLNAPGAFPSGTAISYRDDIHTVKAGINYHFNWGNSVAASRY
jgi:outer membrane immunogenic protein